MKKLNAILQRKNSGKKKRFKWGQKEEKCSKTRIAFPFGKEMTTLNVEIGQKQMESNFMESNQMCNQG